MSGAVLPQGRLNHFGLNSVILSNGRYLRLAIVGSGDLDGCFISLYPSVLGISVIVWMFMRLWHMLGPMQMHLFRNRTWHTFATAPT
jgi:hypothetical protein